MPFDRFLQQACPDPDLVWRKYRRRSAKHRIGARLGELDLDGYTAAHVISPMPIDLHHRFSLAGMKACDNCILPLATVVS